MAKERSADDHRGTQRWKIAEDLRSHLDSLVEELGRMPTNSELRLRKCGALGSAISQFGCQGPPQFSSGSSFFTG